MDYHCSVANDHHFAMRVANHNMLKLRVRFGEGEDKLVLKVHYDQGYSEVWNYSCRDNRYRIDQIIVPDFTDIEKIKNKIRTILVFG